MGCLSFYLIEPHAPSPPFCFVGSGSLSRLGPVPHCPDLDPTHDSTETPE